MYVTCQFSLYPLRAPSLGTAIEAAVSAIRAHGLDVELGAMSSVVTGPTEIVFRALHDGFVAAANGHCVLVVTVSNACPQPTGS